MKVERHDEGPSEFKPIKVTITVQSEAELIALRRMAAMNITIPDAVANYYGSKCYSADVYNFLAALAKALKSPED